MERSLDDFLDAMREGHDGEEPFDPEPARVEWEKSFDPVRRVLTKDWIRQKQAD